MQFVSKETSLVKYLFVLAIGTALGFYVAHRVNQTPAGQEFFTGLDSRLGQFRAAVVDGYRAREAELRDQA
ncbi:hypothetical protein [Frondihabitans australicus]|uniref:Uncharacterized protein n=1 Tax=Frondihabitans australicus TaxID=386892 RepID=A0A495IF25_9MICO|nr:hypothetical protein [Frondihabitans australicus]RKR74088.1 hypothetical protein C8E83_1194 [Frondihabitans australicus]